MDYLILPLYALIICTVVVTLVWWRQLFTKNAGVIDAWWSYNFGFIVLLYAVLGEAVPEKKIIISGMVIMWSLRLGTHLLIRNGGHAEEDMRYQKLRTEYGKNQAFRMWLFFFYQAISNVLLSLPFLLICMDPDSEMSGFLYAGAMLWLIAIIGESIADHQLAVFKNNPENKGKVCTIGLWRYSRHPNYFFEWLIWVAFALAAMGSPYGIWSITCPIVMYLLLTRVTGIPLLEKLAVKTKGAEYVNYQRTTSPFFPWFKKGI